MKKQLVIKISQQEMTKQRQLALNLRKRLNRNVFFQTSNRIVLNEINKTKFKRFFHTIIDNVNQQYQILISRKQDQVQDYAKQVTVSLINDIDFPMQKRRGYYIIKIPFLKIWGGGNIQYYYRMYFWQSPNIYKDVVSVKRFIQQNGRNIKPIYVAGNNKRFISTSPIFQASVLYDIQKKSYKIIINQYSIQTKSGKITRNTARSFITNDPTLQHLQLDLTRPQLKVTNSRMHVARSFKEEKKNEKRS